MTLHILRSFVLLCPCWALGPSVSIPDSLGTTDEAAVIKLAAGGTKTPRVRKVRRIVYEKKSIH